MRGSLYVGRVGGLAVALGIGVAIGVSGLATAEATPGDSPSAGADSWANTSSPNTQTLTSPVRIQGGRALPSPSAQLSGRRITSATKGSALALAAVQSDTAKLAPSLPVFTAVLTAPSRRAGQPVSVSTPAPVGQVALDIAQTGHSTEAPQAAVKARAETSAPPSLSEIIQDTLFHKSAAVDPQQTVKAGVITGRLNASTPDGSAVTYSLATAPTNGAVALAQDGSYVYTPNANLATTGGTDSFSITIDNGNPAYRLTGIGGAIQGIIATLAQLVGLRQPDAFTVAIPVNFIGALQHNTVIDTITLPNNYGSPRGIAVSPDGKRLYVANNTDYTIPFINTRVHNYSVAMIDTTTKAVSSPINAGFNPFQVAFSPDGKRVYVANFGGTLSTISTATNTAGPARTISGALRGMAITPDGRSLYLLGDSEVSVVDASSVAQSAVIAVGTRPTAIAINSAGTRAYVTSGTTGTNSMVSVIDTATNTVSASIAIPGPDVYGSLAAIAVSPDGSRVYVTNFSSVIIDTFVHNFVSVIDTATNTLIGSPILVGYAPDALAVSPDGNRVYVANAGGTVSVIDTATSVATATIRVGSVSTTIAGLALSPDGSRLYATDQWDGKVTVIAT